MLRSFRPARFRGQDPLTQTIISPALWYFLPVWNMRLTLPRGFSETGYNSVSELYQTPVCKRYLPCYRHHVFVLGQVCVMYRYGNPPYHSAHRMIFSHHTYTSGGAHPGGAVIESSLRVRLCRGLASRREPESHGTQMGITHKDLRRRGKPCC